MALHIKKEGKIFRAVVKADFVKQLLEENFSPPLLQQFFSSAKIVEKPKRQLAGILLVDEEKKRVLSDQTAFRLSSLDNIYEPWEYIEVGLFDKIEDIP